MGRFSFSCSPVAKHGIYKTRHMRITVLTPRLVRLETGFFTDFPTQTVWNRDFPKVSCTTSQEAGIFTLNTGEVIFKIRVADRKMHSVEFPDGTVITDFRSGNLLGTARTLDAVNGGTKLDQGIMSLSGVAVMDDSRSLLLGSEGEILPRERCSDLYYFAYGHDYLGALRDFYRLTGPVPLIPKFALGNWWSRYRAYTQEEYRELMKEFIRRELPITVATIDMDWHWTDVKERFGDAADPGPGRTPQEKWYNSALPGWTGYSWNNELFPDHRELLLWLKKQGFHITLNIHPSQGFRAYEDCYESLCTRLGRDPGTRERIPFDIADTAFVEAYLDCAHHPEEEKGVDFWWIDWQQGKVTNIPGLDPLWALNHYHTLDNGRDGKRPLILSRYAGLGSHRYPLGFSGDTHTTWESLRFQPYFTNTAANAGYTWWSHDIGGHMFGIQDDELYVRWLQYGVFSPINRLHSSNSDFMGKEPWKRSFAANAVSERFLRLRHKLIPFLYSANFETHLNAIPLCMPMYYRYDREEAYQVRNQYIFGSQLLVAPITQPADKRLNLAKTALWLPEGRWTDIFTGRIYRGGGFVTMFRDLDSIPVLAGEGTIVPMYARDRSNDLSPEQPLEIHIWRGSNTYTLWEDDGFSANTSRCATIFDLSQEENELRLRIRKGEGDREILPETRTVTLCFRDITAGEVSLDGHPVKMTEGRITLEVHRNAEHEIQIRNPVCSVNPSKSELKGNLLTRVQGGNNWKNALFTGSERRYPAFLREALREFDTMIWE